MTIRVEPNELSQFITRRERIESEIKEHQETKKELHAELVGRGYDLKAFNELIKLRKKSSDEIAEEEAVMDLYKSALGMA